MTESAGFTEGVHFMGTVAFTREAHTEEDVDRTAEAFDKSVALLREDGYLTD